MKTVKLEDLKKELENLVEDVVEDIISPTPSQDIANEDTVVKDGVFSEADTTETSISGDIQSIFDEIALPVEDIFQGESQKTEETAEKEIDQKPSSKFKSVEELEKAYNELEKEFTRRCQKLAKYEKEIGQSTETPGEWKAKVDKFFDETPDAKQFAREIAGEISKDASLRSRSDCLEVALTRVLLSRYRTPRDLATDEEFLKEHILGSDFVKKAVIDGYMKDLRAGKPPVLISKAGQNTVAPRNKPQSIQEAGRLFQQNNK